MWNELLKWNNLNVWNSYAQQSFSQYSWQSFDLKWNEISMSTFDLRRSGQIEMCVQNCYKYREDRGVHFGTEFGWTNTSIRMGWQSEFQRFNIRSGNQTSAGHRKRDLFFRGVDISRDIPKWNVMVVLSMSSKAQVRTNRSANVWMWLDDDVLIIRRLDTILQFVVEKKINKNNDQKLENCKNSVKCQKAAKSPQLCEWL